MGDAATNGRLEDLDRKRRETSSHEGATQEEEEMDGPFSRRTIRVVFISLVLDLLAFTMILPLLPSLLDYYAQHDKVG